MIHMLDNVLSWAVIKKIKIIYGSTYMIIAVGVVSQRDSMGMVNENNELKLRLQAMEQQAQLREGK